MLSSVTLTQRMVVSILAELYDPCGFWDIKIKTDVTDASRMDWDEHIRPEDQESWKQQLC